MSLAVEILVPTKFTIVDGQFHRPSMILYILYILDSLDILDILCVTLTFSFKIFGWGNSAAAFTMHAAAACCNMLLLRKA